MFVRVWFVSTLVEISSFTRISEFSAVLDAGQAVSALMSPCVQFCSSNLFYGFNIAL